MIMRPESTTPSPYAADLDLALSLADTADLITRAHFREEDLDVRLKADASEVSTGDLETERAIRDALARQRPEDSVYGEEFGGERQTGRSWIVDPIDGTGNYVRGVPVWATLIALAVDGVPVVGVVSAPLLGRRWWAAAGAGAWESVLDSDAQPLRVSTVAAVADAFVSVGSVHQWDAAGLPWDRVVALARTAHRSRDFGDFLPYMFLAEGALDAVAEPDLKPYDMAALFAIVSEAGGRFTSLGGDADIWHGSAVATNGALHDEVLTALR